jgi:hypothetical protein
MGQSVAGRPGEGFASGGEALRRRGGRAVELRAFARTVDAMRGHGVSTERARVVDRRGRQRLVAIAERRRAQIGQQRGSEPAGDATGLLHRQTPLFASCHND